MLLQLWEILQTILQPTIYLPYEDLHMTASSEPPYRIHVWRYSLHRVLDLL